MTNPIDALIEDLTNIRSLFLSYGYDTGSNENHTMSRGKSTWMSLDISSNFNKHNISIIFNAEVSCDLYKELRNELSIFGKPFWDLWENNTHTCIEYKLNILHKMPYVSGDENYKRIKEGIEEFLRFIKEMD